MVNPKLDDMVHINELNSFEVDDPDGLLDLAREADAFLLSQKWCRSIKECWISNGIAKVFALFYYEIDPVDDASGAVWVITGDVPPAYIDVESCPTARDAVRGYVAEMTEWVQSVYNGRPVDQLIPVVRRGSLDPVVPNMEFAKMLASRLGFVEAEILPYFEG